MDGEGDDTPLSNHRRGEGEMIRALRIQGSGLRDLHGFTLMELIIAIFITALAIAGAYAAFIAQQRSFTVQDQVAETDVTSKIAFDMMVNDIRLAGFGYPEDEPSINGYTGKVTISDGAGPNNSDIITLIGGFRHIANLGLTASQRASGQTALTTGTNTIIVCYTGSTRFNTAQRRYLSIDGVMYAEVTNVSPYSADCNFNGTDESSNVELITLDRVINYPFPVDPGRRVTPVYLVEDITYQLVQATGSNCNNAPAGTLCLERIRGGDSPGTPPDTIAQYVEDLQFAGIDQDSDGDIDRVRVSLLARTAREDPDLNPSTKPYYPSITLENNPASISVDDGYRRRIWAMEVGIRN